MPHLETLQKIICYLIVGGFVSALISVLSRIILDICPNIERVLLGEKPRRRKRL